MIRDDFRMHRARVLPLFLMLMLLLVILLDVQAIQVNRPYLCVDAYRERNCAD
jgi:hypothetical protein